MKLFSHFMLANTRNPLKQGISSNHKPRRKFTERGNFPHPRKRKARQASARSVQDHPLKDRMKEKREWSIQDKGSIQWPRKSILFNEGKP